MRTKTLAYLGVLLFTSACAQDSSSSKSESGSADSTPAPARTPPPPPTPVPSPRSIASPTPTPTPTPLTRRNVLQLENIGGIKIGMSPQEVKALFPEEPPKVGDTKFIEATNRYLQTWTYPNLFIEFASDTRKGPMEVFSVTAEKGSDLLTARGATLTMPDTEVARIYDRVGGFENPEPGAMFMVGTIHAGLIFYFDQEGLVSRIFLGSLTPHKARPDASASPSPSR